jgi:hypothetical protein
MQKLNDPKHEEKSEAEVRREIDQYKKLKQTESKPKINQNITS